MMRCGRFHYHAPRTLRDACAMLQDAGSDGMLLAGGTDLVPNMKRRQQTPKVVISLRHVAGLRDAGPDGNRVRLGAMLTLSDLTAKEEVRARHTALFKAAAQVATPHLRNMGTLGGNLCLDTRCNYYDQNYEWRKAINFCMKKAGEICWVAPSSRRCWAISSTDTAPALIALGAEVALATRDGERTLGVADFCRDDGIQYLTRNPDEILTQVLLPIPAPGESSTYWKLRRRGSFDFPVLSVAAWIRRPPEGRVEAARLVLGSVASRPVIAEAAAGLVGTTLSEDVIEAVAEEASRLAKPLDNTDFSLGWRKKAARYLITGALRELRGDDPQTLGPLARRAAELAPVG
ncbi:MAG: 4-hydroxybenzoyl-CoA reductase [Acidobacteria bacterium]|nr:MAG: 4-hydroxybenzoyl-CoA reductase [Acidobacteriota bacterium]